MGVGIVLGLGVEGVCENINFMYHSPLLLSRSIVVKTSNLGNPRKIYYSPDVSHTVGMKRKSKGVLKYKLFEQQQNKTQDSFGE